MIADLRRELDVVGEEMSRMQLEWAKRESTLDALTFELDRQVRSKAAASMGKNVHINNDENDDDGPLTIIFYPPDGHDD